MSQPDNETPNLIHHYAHVVYLLNETRKGSPTSDDDLRDATSSINLTIQNLCRLIDALTLSQMPKPSTKLELVRNGNDTDHHTRATE